MVQPDLMALLSELEDIAAKQETLVNLALTFAETVKGCATVAEALRLADELQMGTFAADQRDLSLRASNCWAAFTSGVEAAQAEGSIGQAEIARLTPHLDRVRERFENFSKLSRQVPKSVQTSLLELKTRFGSS